MALNSKANEHPSATLARLEAFRDILQSTHCLRGVPSNRNVDFPIAIDISHVVGPGGPHARNCGAPRPSHRRQMPPDRDASSPSPPRIRSRRRNVRLRSPSPEEPQRRTQPRAGATAPVPRRPPPTPTPRQPRFTAEGRPIFQTSMDAVTVRRLKVDWVTSPTRSLHRARRQCRRVVSTSSPSSAPHRGRAQA